MLGQSETAGITVNTEFLVQQLAQSSPMLMAFIVGCVLSLSYMARARTACIVSALAFGIMIVIHFVALMIQATLVDGLRAGGEDAVRATKAMTLVGLVFRCIQAAATIMIAVAVVLDRPTRE